MFRAGTCALLLAACSARCGGGPNRVPYVEVRRTPAVEPAPVAEPAEEPEPAPTQPYVAPAAEPIGTTEPAPPDTEIAAPPRAPLPDEPLAIDVRGERFPFRHAFAWSRGGRALFISFSTRETPECGHPEQPAPEERSVHIVFAPQLAFRGGEWWASDLTAFLRTDLLSSRGGDPNEFPAAIDDEPSERGDRVRGAIDADAGALRARGRFEAIYCGEHPGIAAPQSFPDIALEVGGERVIVRGARVLLQDDMVRLVLSSAGTDCRALGDGADIELELVRHADSGQSDIYLRGHRLGSGSAQIFGGGTRVPFRYTIDGPLTEGATARANVLYTGDLGSVPVALRGTVDALVCPRL